MPTRCAAALTMTLALAATASAGVPAATITPEVAARVVSTLKARHPAQAERIRLGVDQVAARWWAADGDEAAFTAFCESAFVADQRELDRTADRLERVLEQIDGRLHEIRRELMTPLDLDTGPVTAVDGLLANLDLAAHVDEDLFTTRVAFLVLLNFPVRTPLETAAAGPSWDRATWARARLAERFADRVPATVIQAITRATTAADAYIAEYNIRMDRLLDTGDRRVFPEGLRLISHWGIRDELKSWYGQPGGLDRQRLIARVMERILRQEIPVGAIDNADVEWRSDSNEIRPAPGASLDITAAMREREPDTRYRRILDCFHALREADRYTPGTPSAIARAYDLGRQMSEKQVEALLVSVLAAPEVAGTGRLIARRLGRPLEAFDIWYNGFRPKRQWTEAQLDAIVAKRYPTPAAFQADLPRVLTTLGFTPERAGWLANRIVVDPSRGAGHASGAVRRGDRAHLRTRIPATGMTYKGFNIAIHELGHNVEQVLSLDAVDHWLLNGVPNTAFTEAFAFAFQRRDLEVLGLVKPGDDVDSGAEALNDLWATYEIAGVSLVDLQVWRHMYAHPEVTPGELREATLAAAREVWNAYFAPVFGVRDCELLAVYSHMVSAPLYLPDYPLGHIIAFQVAERLTPTAFGTELERMARQGRVTPDVWMRGAVGGPVSTRPLLEAAARALQRAN